VNRKQERINLLERQVGRLQKRIALLEQRSNTYSWTRVTIFFGGLGLAILLFFLLNRWWGVGLALLTIVLFAIAARFHARIERSLARHKLLSHIKTIQLARIHLNWDVIPPAYPLDPSGEHPFEIDLDITGFRSLHQLLNTAVSREGSQRLHDWLLTTTPDLQEIRQRQTLVRELAPLTLFRDKLLMNSLLASRRSSQQLEGKRLLNWLGQQAQSTSLLPLLLGASALCLLTIALLLLNVFAGFPPLWTFSVLCTLTLFFSTAHLRGDLFDDSFYLRDAFGTLSSVFEYLEHYPYGSHLHLKKICEPFFVDHEQRPSLLLKRTARIASASTLKNNGILWLVINALVPWDAYCAYRLQQCKIQIATRLPEWLDVWFELEALCSLATFAYLNPEYILPTIMSPDVQGEHAVFSGQGLGHPLIQMEKKVTNDFTMTKLGEVVIVTGSNMAGKSTFLRTLGVNLCLAYAGGSVNATLLNTSLFRLFTCIRVSDSVADGYSYFYAEVRRLKALLGELAKPEQLPLFFLVDEIFKGTNNRERLIGSRSYVRAVVGRNCVGLISTHDLELVRLADILPDVSNQHFREDVIDGGMVFDYILRSGPSPTTNALKIMRMEGLPIEEGYDES
jgi:ABC-type multidrug transport system fused ATPase/permease subunit